MTPIWWTVGALESRHRFKRLLELYADGTQSALSLSNATPTLTGFDLTLPFSAGPTISYTFEALAYEHGASSR